MEVKTDDAPRCIASYPLCRKDDPYGVSRYLNSRDCERRVYGL